MGSQLSSVRDRRESSWCGSERRTPRNDSRQVGRKAHTVVNPPQSNATPGTYWHRSVSPDMACAVVTSSLFLFQVTLQAGNVPIFLSLISPPVVLPFRATYKVCETDRWELVLPLAASAPSTKPWSTWTTTPAPRFPSQPRLPSSESETRRDSLHAVSLT